MGYGSYKNEDGVLLKSGTQLQVKDDPLKRSDGSYTVHLIEIDQPLTSTITKSLDVIPKLMAKSTLLSKLYTIKLSYREIIDFIVSFHISKSKFR